MRNVSDEFVENQNNFLRSTISFFENLALCEIAWKKYCKAKQTTHDRMTHAHCILDNHGYRHTLRMRNTYCFSTATKRCTNAPQCYVIRTMPAILLVINLSQFYVEGGLELYSDLLVGPTWPEKSPTFSSEKARAYVYSTYLRWSGSHPHKVDGQDQEVSIGIDWREGTSLQCLLQSDHFEMCNCVKKVSW
jgi:hypothetical protein